MPLKDPEARKEYHKQYMKQYLERGNNRDKHRARAKVNNKINHERQAEVISRFRANGCTYCDEKTHVCLDAHHLDPALKEFTIGQARGQNSSIPKLEAELAKCICICSNCHRKLHAGVLCI